MRRDASYSATVAKRQLQLQEMRDKLKDKHKKDDLARLRQNLAMGDGHSHSSMESGFSHGVTGAGGGFFAAWSR